jgi:hypothetical protein
MSRPAIRHSHISVTTNLCRKLFWIISILILSSHLLFGLPYNSFTEASRLKRCTFLCEETENELLQFIFLLQRGSNASFITQIDKSLEQWRAVVVTDCFPLHRACRIAFDSVGTNIKLTLSRLMKVILFYVPGLSTCVVQCMYDRERLN